MASDRMTSMFGGIPFVDDAFAPSAALTAVAAVRAHLCGKDITRDGIFEAVISPTTVYHLARKHYGPHPPIYARDPTQSELQAIQAALAQLRITKPRWTGLFALPTRYMILDGDAILSMSNPVVPQFVFLSAAALADVEILAESVVHELSHVWLALLHEIRPLATPDARSYVLPSGTKGKSNLGVLLAAHFAATVIRLYEDAASRHLPRLEFLSDYLDGTLRALESMDTLTADGRDACIAMRSMRRPVGGASGARRI